MCIIFIDKEHPIIINWTFHTVDLNSLFIKEPMKLKK